VAARREPRRRGYRRRADRQHALPPHAQERAAFQGGCASISPSPISLPRRSSCRRARR
jgi:hypothetical protein